MCRKQGERNAHEEKDSSINSNKNGLNSRSAGTEDVIEGEGNNYQSEGGPGERTDIARTAGRKFRNCKKSKFLEPCLIWSTVSEKAKVASEW